MGIMITYHGYNNGNNNPIYNAHKNVDMHYTWQNIVLAHLMERGCHSPLVKKKQS